MSKKHLGNVNATVIKKTDRHIIAITEDDIEVVFFTGDTKKIPLNEIEIEMHIKGELYLHNGKYILKKVERRDAKKKVEKQKR